MGVWLWLGSVKQGRCVIDTCHMPDPRQQAASHVAHKHLSGRVTSRALSPPCPVPWSLRTLASYSNTLPIWDHGLLHRAEAMEKQPTKKKKKEKEMENTTQVLHRLGLRTVSGVPTDVLVDRLLITGWGKYAFRLHADTGWLAWLVVLTLGVILELPLRACLG